MLEYLGNCWNKLEEKKNWQRSWIDNGVGNCFRVKDGVGYIVGNLLGNLLDIWRKLMGNK